MDVSRSQFQRPPAATPQDSIRALQSNQSLSKEAIEGITTQFLAETEGLSFNTMSLLLELAGAVRHSSSSWKDIFDSQAFDGSQLLQKYRGGNPCMVCSAFAQKLKQQGIDCVVLGERRMNCREFLFPTPGVNTVDTPMEWQEAVDLLQGFSHFCVAVRYTNQQGEEKVLLLKKWFNSEPSVQHFGSFSKFLNDAFGFSLQPAAQVSDVESVLKNTLQVKFTYHLQDLKSKEVLQLNVLDGTLLVRPQRQYKGITNQDGKAEFSLHDLLTHSDEFVSVIKDGCPCKIKAEDVLREYLSDVANLFSLSSDFAENLAFLIQQRQDLVNQVMLPPAGTILALWPEYKNCDVKHQQAAYLAARSNQESDRTFIKATNTFLDAIRALNRGDAEAAQSGMEKASQGFDQFMIACAKRQAEPLDLLLEEFSYQ